MNDSLPVVFVLAVVFVLMVIWAALGHVIWLALAWLLRNVFGKEELTERVTPVARSVCLRCGAKASLDSGFCSVCDVSTHTTVSVLLLLAIVTMIWYASANLGWTWLWYVAGIATGATIIFMFAVFEKKRHEVLRLVEGLKEWER